MTTRIASACAALAAVTYLMAHRAVERARTAVATRNDDGQATAEYALVLLGAAAIALAVISWATRTNLVGKLLDVVFGGLLSKVK